MIDFLIGFLLPGSKRMPIRAQLAVLGLIALVGGLLAAALML